MLPDLVSTASTSFRLLVLTMALASLTQARTHLPLELQKASAREEQPRPAPQETPLAVDLDSSVQEVLVPISITDASNRFQEGIDKSGILAFDGNQPLTVQDAWVVHLPLRLSILLDGSSSMHGRISAARRVISILAGELRQGDSSSLSSFLAEPRLLSDFKASSSSLTQAADALKVSHLGFTGIYDSAFRLLQQHFPQPSEDQATGIIVITDGLDTVSKVLPSEISETALRLGVPIYVIGIRSPDDASESDLPSDERLAHRKLSEWAAGTRGRAVFTTSGRDLDSELLQVMKDLRSRIMLSLTPPEGQESIQALQIQAQRPDLKIWLPPASTSN